MVVVAGALVAIGAGAFVVLGGRGGVEVRVARAEVRGGGGAAAGSGITANGYVVARTKASVASKIAGRLESLEVEEGSVVREGEVIARLEHGEYDAALAESEARLAQQRAALLESQADRDQVARDEARSRELLAADLISTQEAEALTAHLVGAEARVRLHAAQVEAARAAVALARANLDNTNIRAPFDGTVLRKDAEVGEVVAPVATGGGLTRGAVVTMADLQTLEVEVDVNEAYIGQIRNDQPAAITLNAYPDTTFAGRVRQIVPTADRQKATVLVKVAVLDRDPRILPEMGAKVEFAEPASPAGPAPRPRVVIPAAAVRDREGRSVVWLVVDGRLRMREVEALPVSGGVREIRSGLSGGEEVVVEGPAELREGERATIASS